MAQATAAVQAASAGRPEPDRNLALDLRREVKLNPHRDEDARRAQKAELDLEAILTASDLVSGDDSFFVMTGITDGELLHGVRYRPHRTETDSLVVRSRSSTVREVHSNHWLDRLERYSTIDYRHASPVRRWHPST